MVGALREHVVVSLNLAAAFKQRLRGGPCQVYISESQAARGGRGCLLLPRCDGLLRCRRSCVEPLHRESDADRRGAVEIHRGFRSGDKFAAYRSLASLREYVLVEIPSRRVETFRRRSEQEWLFHEVPAAAAAECLFPSLDLSVPLAEVFENLPDRP